MDQDWTHESAVVRAAQRQLLIDIADRVWDAQLGHSLINRAALLQREQTMIYRSRAAIDESRELLHKVEAMLPEPEQSGELMALAGHAKKARRRRRAKRSPTRTGVKPTTQVDSRPSRAVMPPPWQRSRRRA